MLKAHQLQSVLVVRKEKKKRTEMSSGAPSLEEAVVDIGSLRDAAARYGKCGNFVKHSIKYEKREFVTIDDDFEWSVSAGKWWTFWTRRVERRRWFWTRSYLGLLDLSLKCPFSKYFQHQLRFFLNFFR